jgi:acetyl-CoA synthetase
MAGEDGMSEDLIGKSEDDAAHANMHDYAAERASFSWDQARKLLDGLPGGKLNIAYEAVDRHVDNGSGDKTAFRLIAKDESATDISYRDLMHLTNRFANALRSWAWKRATGSIRCWGASRNSIFPFSAH